MSMDGELAIGKLSETNLYFKLSPYLLLGKAPSEWFLPNNLIRNLISWLNSLTSNKCTHLNISILLALTEQFNTSTCIAYQVLFRYLCHKIIWSLLPSNIWSNYNSPSPSALCHLDCLSGGGKLPKMLCIFAVSGLPDLCLIYNFPPPPQSIRSFVMGVISTFLIIWWLRQWKTLIFWMHSRTL